MGGGGAYLGTGESGEYFEGESEDLVNFLGEGGSVDRGDRGVNWGVVLRWQKAGGTGHSSE